MRPYVVRQGDYLTKLAHAAGVDARALWNHPKNNSLRETRPNAEILHPGDIVYLPDPSTGQSIQAGQSNRYRADPPTVPVQVRFRDDAGQPLSGKAFVVRGSGDEIHGTTDQDGLAKFDVNVTARQVLLELTELGRTHRVLVGDMDPITEGSGVWKRLRHLGYLASRHIGPGGAYGGALSRAVSQFQLDSGLEATGTIDDATRDALEAAHGS